MPGCSATSARELAQDPAAGRAAARVGDAAARVAALEAEREVAVAVGVEARRRARSRSRKRAGASSVRTSAARARGRARGRRRACPRGAAPASRRRRARRRARPGPSRRRSRPAGGRRRASTRAPSRAAVSAAKARPRRRPRRRGRPGPWRRRPVRYPRVRGPSGCATTRSLAHDVPGPSGAAGADRRAGGGDGAPRLVRLRRACEAPAATREQLLAVHPARAHRLHRGAVRAPAAGTIDADTVAVPATYEAALRAAGGAVALVDALLGGRGARPAFVGAAPARPPRRAGAGDGVLLLRQRRRWRRGRRASAHGVERVLILDWDVHHGNGTNDDLPRRPERAVRLDPRVAAVSGDRAGVATSGRATGEGYTVNLPVPGGQRATRPTARWSSTSCVPLIAAWEPQLVLVSAGFDAHR